VSSVEESYGRDSFDVSGEVAFVADGYLNKRVGLSGNLDLPERHRHFLTLEQSSDEPETFFHFVPCVRTITRAFRRRRPTAW